MIEFLLFLLAGVGLFFAWLLHGSTTSRLEEAEKEAAEIAEQVPSLYAVIAIVKRMSPAPLSR